MKIVSAEYQSCIVVVHLKIQRNQIRTAEDIWSYAYMLRLSLDIILLKHGFMMTSSLYMSWRLMVALVLYILQ